MSVHVAGRQLRSSSELERQREVAELAARQESMIMSLGDHDPPSPSLSHIHSAIRSLSRNQFNYLANNYTNNNNNNNNNSTNTTDATSESADPPRLDPPPLQASSSTYSEPRSADDEKHLRTSSDAVDDDPDLQPVQLQDRQQLNARGKFSSSDGDDEADPDHTVKEEEEEDGDDEGDDDDDDEEAAAKKTSSNNSSDSNLPSLANGKSLRVQFSSGTSTNTQHTSTTSSSSSTSPYPAAASVVAKDSNLLPAAATGVGPTTMLTSVAGVTGSSSSSSSTASSQLEEEEATIRETRQALRNKLHQSSLFQPQNPLDIRFNREDVPQRSPDGVKASPLTSQLQKGFMRPSTSTSIDDDGRKVVDRYSTTAPPSDGFRVTRSVKCTVYLPNGSDIVQLQAKSACTASQLIHQVLKQYKLEHPTGASPDMQKDTFAYRLYIAEEDGEIDDDCPPLDDGCPISSTGSDTFALRVKVARVPQPLDIHDPNSVSSKSKSKKSKSNNKHSAVTNHHNNQKTTNPAQQRSSSSADEFSGEDGMSPSSSSSDKSRSNSSADGSAAGSRPSWCSCLFSCFSCGDDAEQLKD